MSETSNAAARPAPVRRRGGKRVFDYSSVEPRNFLPCPFQVKLFEEAKSSNLIVCLENDFGKAFIATKLLEHFSPRLRFQNPMRRLYSVMVDTNATSLTNHATTIRNHVDLQVVSAPSNKANVELDKDHWTEQLGKADILALHPQVLVELLAQQYISIDQINLLVLNDLHLHLNDPNYLRIMKFYNEAITETKPRILGLAANILENQIGYAAIANLIDLLESRFASKCRTIFNNYSRPKELVYEYEHQLFQLKDVNNFDRLLQMIQKHVNFVNESKIKPKNDAPIPLNQIAEYFEHLAYVLEHMGLWCAWKLCDLYYYELTAIAASFMSKDPLYASILSATASLFNYARLFFNEILQQYSVLNQLLKLSSKKLVCVVHLLCQFHREKTNENQAEVKEKPCRPGVNDDFSCLIFCQQRVIVRVLYLYLKEVAAWNLQNTRFIKPDFVMGQSSGKRTRGAFSRPNRKQEESLLRFKKKEVNVLVACSVFEERLDLPKSNVIIAFDLPKTTKEYIQFKEKTCNESSCICFLIEKHSNERERMFDLAKQEKLLLDKCKDYVDRLVDTEKPMPPINEREFLPVFQPDPEYLAVNATNAIAIVNRYCLKLPSDSFTKLFPQCNVERVDGDLFVCKFRLPINSPIRLLVTGSPMPTVKLAKKSCAIEVCKILYANGEVNEHFLPVGKESFYFAAKLGLKPSEEELEELKNESRTGTTKKRRYYNKRVSKVLQGHSIRSGEQCYLYLFSMALTCPIPEEQNTRGRKIVDPAQYPRWFAMLINKEMPKVCSFPVFTRSGEVIVSLKRVPGTITLDDQQIQKLVGFHKFTFKNVLQLERYPMKFNVQDSNCSYLLVPVDYDVRLADSELHQAHIDWPFLDALDQYEEKTLSELAAATNQAKTDSEADKFVFDRRVYEDAVVRPWYRTNEFQFYFYVAQICDNLNPLSDFPDDTHCTFADYYRRKYKVQITNMEQPLLDVDHTSARLNLLTHRYVNRKGVTLPMSSDKTKKEKQDNLNKKQMLVPELCIVHPFPASFWQKAVCMPCILYRINSLLLADELRSEVCYSTGIGKVQLADDEHWGPLDFGWTLSEVLGKNANENDLMIRASAAKTTTSKPMDHIGTGLESTKDTFEDDFVIDVFDPEKHKVEPHHGDWSDVEEFFDEEEELMKDVDLQQLNSGSMMFTINSQTGIPDTWGKPLDGNSMPIPNGKLSKQSESPCSWTDAEVENAIQMLDFEGPGLSSISLGNVNHLNMDGLTRDLAKLKSDEVDDLLNEYDTDDDDMSVEEIGLSDEEAAEFDPTYIQSKVIGDEPSSNRKEQILKEILNTGVMIRRPIKVDDNLRKVLETNAELHGKPAIDVPFDPTTKFTMNVFNDNFEYAAEDNETVKLESFFDGIRDLHKLELQVKPEKQRKEGKRLVAVVDEVEPTEDNVEPCFGELLPCRQQILDRQNAKPNAFEIRFDAHKQDYQSSFGPSPAMILQALTMSNAGDGINLERLETVGDSFLKYAVTAYLYCACEKIHEGKLSYLRSRQISNYNLFRLGREKLLGELMVATKFEPNDNWLPPTFVIPKGLEKALVDLSLENNSNVYSIEPLKEVINSNADENGIREAVEKHKSHCIINGQPNESDDESDPSGATMSRKKANKDTSDGKQSYVPYNLLTQQSIPDKSIADCVESLIGAYLISSGPKGALLFMMWLGLKVMPEQLSDLNSDPNDTVWHWLPRVPTPLVLSEELCALDVDSPEFPIRLQSTTEKLHRIFTGFGLDVFERDVLGYQFKDKSYLVQAFTHNSYYDNVFTDCYQRLEFLGDAVLDFLITRYLYEDPAKHTPGVLTDLRSALVNNTFFASLAVKYGFHKYLKVLSSDLFKVISNFVNKFYQEDEHWISRNSSYLYVEEGESERSEDIEVPKALGDIFESVAGAIFLDSGMSLDAVWNVYFAMMKPEIGKRYFFTSNQKTFSIICSFLEIFQNTSVDMFQSHPFGNCLK